jgi:hypothetical protein
VQHPTGDPAGYCEWSGMTATFQRNARFVFVLLITDNLSVLRAMLPDSAATVERASVPSRENDSPRASAFGSSCGLSRPGGALEDRPMREPWRWLRHANPDGARWPRAPVRRSGGQRHPSAMSALPRKSPRKRRTTDPAELLARCGESTQLKPQVRH